MVTDGFINSYDDRKIPAEINPLRFGRFARPDRKVLEDLAGRHCRGPAVKQASELAFTPEYYDLDGVADVFHAILPAIFRTMTCRLKRKARLPETCRSGNADRA